MRDSGSKNKSKDLTTEANSKVDLAVVSIIRSLARNCAERDYSDFCKKDTTEDEGRGDDR